MHDDLLDLYKTYKQKPLKPETALEIASDFALDLINAFGDNLDQETPLKQGWRSFAPFEFILGLNNVLAKFKQGGWDVLEEHERALLADHGVLLGSLIVSALQDHPDSFPDEDHYQISDDTAKELTTFSETL